MSRQRSGSLANRNFSGSSAATVSAGLGGDDIGQAEKGAKLVAIGECLGKMLAGVDKDDRRRRIDARYHVQERRGGGPKLDTNATRQG
jgi:hypothetical protein